MSDYPARPQTPQAMIHRLPPKPDPPNSADESRKPTKYIVIITASTAFAGKVQISQSVATAISCPFFQGDSLHETSAKAAGVGAAKPPASVENKQSGAGQNISRYQRMWLAKMTRTGYLFPEESRPAMSTEEFSGFGGNSSTSTSRRGSASSAVSSSSDTALSTASSSLSSSVIPRLVPTTKFVNRPPVLSSAGEQRNSNKVLMVITHPELQEWHMVAIRKCVGDYEIGVIFVPLGEEEELPELKPLDPTSMTSFGAFGEAQTPANRTLDEDFIIKLHGGGSVEDDIEDIVIGLREITGA